MDESSSKALVVRSEDGGGGRGTRELSEDEIFEIFARLPVKSLMRFRCLSKHWYNLILSPDFISLHSALSHHRSNKPLTWRINSLSHTVTDTTFTNFTFGLEGREDLVQDLRLNHYPVNVMTCPVEIVGCSNGVVCLSLSPQPETYALWNPATRQVRLIADCPLNWDRDIKTGSGYSSGFCFDPVTNSFKVTQIEFSGTEEGESRVQVHVFSTATNSWTEKMNMTVPYPGGFHRRIRRATCVNGYLHWLKQEKVEDMYILSYDIINEAFERIEMPFRRISSSDDVYLLDAYRGSLALFVHRCTASNVPSNVIDVWVMDHHRGSSPSWSKIPTWKASIKVSLVLRSIGWDDVGFILLFSGLAMCLYDPLNGETKDPLDSTIVMFLCCESLASLN